MRTPCKTQYFAKARVIFLVFLTCHFGTADRCVLAKMLRFAVDSLLYCCAPMNHARLRSGRAFLLLLLFILMVVMTVLTEDIAIIIVIIVVVIEIYIVMSIASHVRATPRKVQELRRCHGCVHVVTETVDRASSLVWCENNHSRQLFEVIPAFLAVFLIHLSRNSVWASSWMPLTLISTCSVYLVQLVKLYRLKIPHVGPESRLFALGMLRLAALSPGFFGGWPRLS